MHIHPLDPPLAKAIIDLLVNLRHSFLALQAAQRASMRRYNASLRRFQDLDRHLFRDLRHVW
jgi:hypothetical protein